jgi:hypothetical protein
VVTIHLVGGILHFGLCSGLMRFSQLILLAALGISVAWGDVESRRAEASGKLMQAFVTMEGRTYRNAVITKIDAGGVSFKHEDGVARLRFDELSPEQRASFGINEETAAEVYRKEAARRAAYERLVEKRSEERRVLAEKEAGQRAEVQRLAMEKAAEERAVAAANKPAETIPPYPTIKRVDSGRSNPSRYLSHRSYYLGYGYPIRYNYSPTLRYGGGYSKPSFRTGINFIVR